MEPADILTPEELSSRLKVRKCWIYNRLRRSAASLPHIRLGRYLGFSWAAVSAWLESQARPYSPHRLAESRRRRAALQRRRREY